MLTQMSLGASMKEQINLFKTGSTSDMLENVSCATPKRNGLRLIVISLGYKDVNNKK